MVWVLMAVVVIAALLAADARRDWVFMASGLVMIIGAAAIAVILVDGNMRSTTPSDAFRYFLEADAGTGDVRH